MTILGDENPTHLIPPPGEKRKQSRVNGRLGARGGKVSRAQSVDHRNDEEHSTRRIQAAMCYLRGLCYAKSNALERSKECYKDAVRLDIQCFEAFNQLMKNSLMSPTEEWNFLGALDFGSVSKSDDPASQQAAELTRMLYMTRLSKYNNPEEFNTAVETLSTDYALASNPDLLLSRAELLFTKCRFREALSLTEAILEDDRYNLDCLPIHLACLHELHEKNALFLLAHDFADHYPEEAATWLAVGVYYLTINKITEARRFFSKSSMMDPHFGPAWIGFAHTFAAEGEHDQAISAYSTAARLFQGTHLPQLFLGMQHLQLQNMTLAHEYLNAAYQLCQTDPLLLNELGVTFYHEEHIEEAINVFKSALTIAQETNADVSSYIPTRINLGHAYRRIEQWHEALAQFDEALRCGGSDGAVLCAKGLVLLEMGEPWEAVVALHEALAINPQDSTASELLGKALEESAASDALDIGHGPGGFCLDDDEVDMVVEAKRRAGLDRISAGVSNRKRKGKEPSPYVDSMDIG